MKPMPCADCPDPSKTSPPIEYLGWRAFYDDLSVYCSREHRWEYMPEDGVLVVMIYMRDVATGSPRNRIVEASFYYLQEQPGRDPIIGQSETSLEDVRRRYPRASVKIGRWTDDVTWHRVEKTAIESKW